MAYKLRYYKEIEHADGKVIRLEIHKKDSTAGAVMIGAVVQGLSLQIQGQQGDIDSPIVKTSLSMTFVDANDINNGRKNGFWEEFYTPDSVLWKVLVKAKDAQGTFRTIWGGYVTPDSFTEDLVYRGSVNIIARDNIGHMQDFPFDAEGDADGMISLYNLVSSAWAKIDSPMALDWRGEEDSILWMNTSEWIPAYDTLMNVSAFEDMNWYQALEKALYSYGVVMRYAGNNRVVVCPLRSMPDYGRESGNIGHLVPQFITGATRELVPAVKRIEESVDYDMVQSLPMPHLKAQDFDGSTNSYRCKIEGVDMGYGSFGTAEHDAPVWPIINGDKGWSNIPSSTLYFSPFAYELGYFSQRRDLGEELLRYTYIAANNVDNRLVTFKKSITCSDFTIRMRLGQPWGLTRQGQLEQQSVFNLWRIYYTIMIDQNGVQEYYDTDRGWRPTYRQLSVVYDPKQENFDFEAFVAVGEHTGKADIYFIISKIEYAQTSLASIHQTGLYAQVQELSFNSPESASLLEKNTVNTNYKAENNVVISRDPEFGPAYNSVALPGFIKNGIFYREGGVIVPAKKWAFGRAGDQQMAVYNHLQLLAYYAKPNNLISGTIVNGDVTRVACIYDWHGAEHMLVSGTYNLLNGHIESAVLREFARYEDMWSDVAGADMPDTEQNSRSNMEGGGASGGGASATYANTTDVNVGGGGGGTGASYLNDLLDVNTDGVVAQSVLYFNGTSWVDMSLATLLNPYVKAEAFNPVKDWFDKLGMLIVEEDGNVVVKTNLVIEGDMASAGAGENPGGGGSVIGGIIVNGMPYTDDDGDGFITLPDYPKKLSALENDLNLGSFAYKNALAVSDIPDLSGKYLPLSGGTITSSSHEALVINRTGGSSPFLLFNSDGVTLGRIGFDVTSKELIASVKGAIQTLLHSGNVGDYAMKYIGATAIAESELPTLNTFGLWHTKGAYIRFGISEAYNITIRTSANKLQALMNASKDADWKTIAFTDSDITGNAATATRSRYIETLGSTGEYWYGDSYKLYAQWHNSIICDWKSTDDANNQYKVRVDIAKKLDTARTIWGQSFDGTGNVSGNLHMGGYDIYWHSDSTHYCIASQLRENASPQLNINFYGGIKFNTGGIDRMLINGNGNVTIGASDLAGTSVKLYVDGYIATSNNKALYGKDTSGNFRRLLVLDNGNDFVLGYGASGAGYNTYLDGNNIYLRYGTSHTAGLILNSSGNVTIGAEDKALSVYKLCVDGDTNIGGNIFIAGIAQSWNNSSPMIYFSRSSKITGAVPKLAIQGIATGSGYNRMRLAILQDDTPDYATQPKEVVSVLSNGNVGIGTTDPQYKLDVAGTGRFTGAVTMSSALDVTGHASIRGGAYLHGGVEVYASTPYIDFHFGNDTADYTSRIIEDAKGRLYLNRVLYLVNGERAGVGGINSSYKFNVEGTTCLNGATTINGKVSASGGIDIPNGQQLAFLDASGNRHTIAWDSASNGILIDGNLIVLGELATGIPMQEIPSIPEIGV